MERLSDYYIASSHNTYLEEDQLFGKTNIDCYINFLTYFGGGCIEIDIIRIEYNKEINNLDIIVGHYMTLTCELYLSDIFKKIKEFLENNNFKKLGPIIISFDNKYISNKNEYKLFWDMFYEYFEPYLYLNFEDNNLYIKDIIGKNINKMETI